MCTHNINGLKCSLAKLTNLFEFIVQKQINICTITDMNLTDSEGFFAIHPQYKKDYRVFWVSKE